MRKTTLIAIILVCGVILFGCLIIFGPSRAPRVPVYQTENITRITFHEHRPPFGEYQVPAEHMQEITAWLGTFQVLHKVDPIDIPAGANGITVEIEYADGTVVHHGIDYPTIDDITYRVRFDDYPTCYFEIIKSDY